MNFRLKATHSADTRTSCILFFNNDYLKASNARPVTVNSYGQKFV